MCNEKALYEVVQSTGLSIISNAKILRDKDIPEDIVEDITNKALNHMKNILKQE